MEITLLIFNRNDNENLIDLIEDMYEDVDHILVIDSSDRERAMELEKFLKNKENINMI